MDYQPQIIIIGAGIVGLSTAYALLEQGMHKVRILEQAVVNHPRCTSSSISRLLRFEYGKDHLYAHMVKTSLEMWQELERRTQKTLYTRSGVLSFGREGDGTREAHEIACELGLSSELMSLQRCRQRFPQFKLEGYDTLTFNAEGGILHASIALQTLKRAILDLGGEISETSRVVQLSHEHQQRPIRLQLASGEEVTADQVVIAIGPWVHSLLKQSHIPIKVTRQYVLYFAGLNPAHLGVGTFPAFIDNDIYGFPIHKGSNNWLKATSHTFGQLVDPDSAIFLEKPVIAQTVHELQTLLPALRKAELAHVEACMYDVSPDEDFILDRLPDDPRIILATGLSGHGFKFGPLLGQILSSLVCETQPKVPLGRFRLARFSRQHQPQKWSVAGIS
jgi:monomeric sarcosine oxidase